VAGRSYDEGVVLLIFSKAINAFAVLGVVATFATAGLAIGGKAQAETKQGGCPPEPQAEPTPPEEWGPYVILTHQEIEELLDELETIEPQAETTPQEGWEPYLILTHQEVEELLEVEQAETIPARVRLPWPPMIAKGSLLLARNYLKGCKAHPEHSCLWPKRASPPHRVPPVIVRSKGKDPIREILRKYSRRRPQQNPPEDSLPEGC
jgi:hypothetical protein